MKILAKIDDNVQICIRKTHDVTTKVMREFPFWIPKWGVRIPWALGLSLFVQMDNQ